MALTIDPYMTSLNKLEGLVGRITFLMHLVNDGTNEIVSAETVRMAVEIGKYYITPTLKFVYTTYYEDKSGNIDKSVADYVVTVSGVEKTVSISDMRRSLRSRIEKMTHHESEMALTTSMDWLEKCGWVKRIDDHKLKRWAINPKVAESFKGYRTDVINARQAVIDIINEGVIRSTGKTRPRRYAKYFDTA